MSKDGDSPRLSATYQQNSDDYESFQQTEETTNVQGAELHATEIIGEHQSIIITEEGTNEIASEENVGERQTITEEVRQSHTEEVRRSSTVEQSTGESFSPYSQGQASSNEGTLAEDGTKKERTSEEESALVHESKKEDAKTIEEVEKTVEEAVKESELTTVFETFWNICNTIQGLPILAIPYTFKVGGWWSLVTLLIIAVTSNYTSVIIVRSLYEEKDGVKIRVRSSYMEIGEAFWPGGGKWLVLSVMVVELLFVATLYPVLVGAMFAKSFPAIKLPLFAWTMIGGLALLPNTLLKTLSQVAWTSIITVVSAKIIFISIIGYSVSKYHKWQIANLDNFEANAFPASVAILVSCYLAQPFVAFIESTMKRPEKFEKTLNWSFVAMTTLNVLIGLIAGVTFYPDTDEVITNNLPVGFFRQIVNAMAAILAFTSYTLPVFTAFDVIETSRSSCLAKNFGENIYSCKVQMLRLSMVLFTILMAAAIPHYTFLLAFVGSVTGITLEFIFPALFHMKIYCTKLHWYEFAMDILVVFIGTLVMTISVIVSWVSMYKCFLNQEC